MWHSWGSKRRLSYTEVQPHFVGWSKYQNQLRLKEKGLAKTRVWITVFQRGPSAQPTTARGRTQEVQNTRTAPTTTAAAVPARAHLSGMGAWSKRDSSVLQMLSSWLESLFSPSLPLQNKVGRKQIRGQMWLEIGGPFLSESLLIPCPASRPASKLALLPLVVERWSWAHTADRSPPFHAVALLCGWVKMVNRLPAIVSADQP